MSWGKFFNEVAVGLDHYSHITEWYKWYGGLLQSLRVIFYIALVAIIIYIFERYYLHRKVDVANKNIDKIVEKTTVENQKLHAELQDIKKQLKGFKQPSRIKRPQLQKRDEDTVKIKSKVGYRSSDQTNQRVCSDDTLMSNGRTKYD